MIETYIVLGLLLLIGIGALVNESQKKKKNKEECEKYILNNLEIYNAEPLFYNQLNLLFEEVPPCSKCGNHVMQLWNFDYNTLEFRCGICKRKFDVSDKLTFPEYTQLSIKLQNFFTLMNKREYLFGKDSGSRGNGWEELKKNINFDYSKLKANTPYIRAMLFEAKGSVEIKKEVSDTTPSRRISQKVKDMVWRRDEGKCIECGSNEKLEFDHIIPHSKGGSNTYRNIQLLCEPCNRIKSDAIG